MTISMHDASVGVFAPYLGSLSGILDRAADHAVAKGIDPAILLSARLHPDMYDFTRQVAEATRHAVLACALLAGVEPPALTASEPDIAMLRARVAAALAFMRKLDPADINGSGSKPVVFRFRNGSEQAFTGQSLLLTFSVPQFFFHVTTAYDILRHCGVGLLKRDFLGTPAMPTQPD